MTRIMVGEEVARTVKGEEQTGTVIQVNRSARRLFVRWYLSDAAAETMSDIIRERGYVKSWVREKSVRLAIHETTAVEHCSAGDSESWMNRPAGPAPRLF